MNHQIIEKEAFEIVGKGIRVSTGNGENLRQIPAFWEQSNSNGFMEDLEKRCGSMGVLGACMEFEFKQENAVEFTYFIGIEQEKDAEPDWEVKEIPPATWAVFESVGPMPDSIQKLTEQIHSEWLPSSDYEHAGTPEMEVYSTGDTTDPNYRCEVWIPVIKNNHKRI